MLDIYHAVTRVYSLIELRNPFSSKIKKLQIFYIRTRQKVHTLHCPTSNITIIVTLLEFALIDMRFKFKFACIGTQCCRVTHMQFCNGGSLLHSRASGAGQIPHSNVDTPHHSQNPSEERNIRVF